MGTVGELAVNITARTAAFEKGMAKSRGRLTEFQKSSGKLGSVLSRLTSGPMAGFTGGMASIGTAVGAASAAIAGMISTTLDMAAVMDKVGKASEKLGISTESLSALQFAAERAGIGQDKLFTSLQRMVRKIGDAQRGMGEAVKTFESLSLSVETLAGLTPDQQFLAIAAAIGKMKTQTEQLSATVKIFDSEGADLVRLLGLGEEGLAAMAARAGELNAIFDDVATQNAAKLVDATADLNAAFTGLKLTIATEFSEPLKVGVDVLTDLTAKAGEASRAIANIFGPAKQLEFYKGLIKGAEPRQPNVFGLAEMGIAQVAKDQRAKQVFAGHDAAMRSLGPLAKLSGRINTFGALIARLTGAPAAISGNIQLRQWQGLGQRWAGIGQAFGGALFGGGGGARGGQIAFAQAMGQGTAQADIARQRAALGIRQREIGKQQLDTQKQMLDRLTQLVNQWREGGRLIIESVTGADL